MNFLNPGLTQNIGRPVIGKRDAEGVNHREDDKHNDTQQARIDIPVAVGFLAGKNPGTQTAQYEQS